MRLGTFDIQSTLARQLISNSLNICSTFLNETNCSGVLYALVHKSSDETCINVTYFIVSKKTAQNGFLWVGIPAALYVLMSYEIDNNGYLSQTSYPSTISDQAVEVTGSLGSE